MNLCINARDAMPAGGTLTVTTENCWIDECFVRTNSVAHVGAYIVLTITDTGVGIDSETLEKIFDPFFTTKEDGTGLGLSNVIAIVKSHDGFVKVTSKVRQGSQFQIYLPAIPPDISLRKGFTDGLKQDNQELLLGNGELVLVVDEEESLRRVIQEILEAYNYRVLTASDGQSAIALCNHQEIQFVLLDLTMPNMDGTLTAVNLLKTNPQVRVILSSGLPRKEALAQAAKVNVTSFLAKPYTAQELLHLLHHLKKG